MGDLSILVSSFDEVKDILLIWHKQHASLKLQYQVFYGLNYLDRDFIKSQNTDFSKKILYSESYSWSYSLKKWLLQIDSPYILLLLDDHIIKKFDYKHIEIILKNLKKKNINFCQLTYASNLLNKFISKDFLFFGKLPKGKYSINLQPSIWEKKSLLKLLENVESAWDFEIKSSLKFNKSNLGIKAIFFLSKEILFYEQYIERGKYYPNRFKMAINKNLTHLLKREKVTLKRRFISHLGFLYKVIKEFFKALKKLKIFKIQQTYF